MDDLESLVRRLTAESYRRVPPYQETDEKALRHRHGDDELGDLLRLLQQEAKK